jgi:5-oxoprolinase (ATP-hydrolysing) subunit B
MRVRRCGSRAALVELDRIEQVLGLHAALRKRPPAGITELVPAARTLLVGFDPAHTGFDRLVEQLLEIEPKTAEHRPGTEILVEVRYDGADLTEVAKLTGITEREVIDLHTGGKYEVAFCGFAPGFGYLTGLDPILRLPRRTTPRTRVPAGAVGLAGEFTGVYPRESPGGWQLIGRTDLRVWDLRREPPALFQPGAPVRFIEAAS